MNIKEEAIDLQFLQHYRQVSKWFKSQHNLYTADFDLLMYLNPFRFFTRVHFQDGTLLCSWEKKRFDRLVRDGWIESAYKGNRRLGEHFKYAVSAKGKQMLNKAYRILVGLDDIPMNLKREQELRKRSYTAKLLAISIERTKTSKTLKDGGYN